MRCSNCGREQVVAKGLCRACYQFRYRNERPRSAEVIAKYDSPEERYRRWQLTGR